MSSTLLKGADQALSQVNPDNSHPHPAGEPWVAFSSFLWRFSLESTDIFFFLVGVCFFFLFFLPKNGRFQVKAAFGASLLIGSVHLLKLTSCIWEGKGT